MIGNYFFSSSGAAAAYEIEQSLRFDRASSHYLNETFAAGQSTWTVSFWVKRANLNGVVQCLFGTSTNGYYNDLGFEGSDRLRFRQVYSGVPSENFEMVSTMRFRDPSAWYHIVLSYCTHGSCASGPAADRAKIWVNNQRLTAFDAAGYPGANVSSLINANNRVHNIGKVGYYDDYLGAYIAEFNFIDGQLLEPDDFGEEDDNGVWRPIEYTGTYGNNNSVYLKFDPSATNGIGHDHSGNGNNWTANNFTTSGTGTDVMSDTPTNNYAVIQRHEVYNASYLSDGNLKVSTPSTSGFAALSSIAMPSTGKYYCEITYTSIAESGIGLRSRPNLNTVDIYYKADGRLTVNGSTTQTGVTWTTGDVMGVCYDCSTKTLSFNKNGSSTGVSTTNSSDATVCFYGLNYGGDVSLYNFGQQGFQYTPPSGYVALNTSNLPTPDIADGSKNMNTVLWTGNGSYPRAITGTGFSPDWVWMKSRSNDWGHGVYDRVRGVGTSATSLRLDQTVPEGDSAIAPYVDMDSFDSDGFTLGNTVTSSELFNYNNATYAGWCWKAGNTSGSSNTNGTITSTVSANPTAGFSIVSYIANGTSTQGDTVGHGLNDAPKWIVAKDRDASQNWMMYFKDYPGAAGGFNFNTNQGAHTSDAGYWNSTAPTNTVFTIGSYHGYTGQHDMIAYCFAEVEGYSRFGTYTANANTDGPFVYCGFKPQWAIIKNASRTNTKWVIVDARRNPYNQGNFALTIEAATEGNDYYYDFVSNGIKIRAGSGYQINHTSGDTYIFMAFAENPFGGSGVSPATAR